jgi:predicted nucleotide-binding protein (sugar kinase/HSP70/actin superfamily)
MEQELIKLGLQYGGATAVLISLYFILSKITEIVKNKNGSNLIKKIDELENNHLKSLETRVERLEDLVLELSERVSRLEAKINGKQI